MRVALALAPENRFILRAGARFLVFNEDPSAAHWLLSRSDAARHDPWLTAAEIAVADVAKQPPQLVRAGRNMLESGKFAPRHLAELAGAIGTLELNSGKNRRARKLFEQSLIDLNENALA